MPWTTPTLREIRGRNRDYIAGALLPRQRAGADALVPNSVLRVMADANGGLSHEVLQYIDWLSKQLLPDVAETEWLDRHAFIWLKNSDGSKGRKTATFSVGSAAFTGAAGTVLPQGTQLVGPNQVTYETVESVTLSGDATPCLIRALDAGSVGNLDPGSSVTLTTVVSGADPGGSVVSLSGGADQESDDDLRVRVLERIQQPPMGGDKTDYVEWALAVPGVTRAWSYPLEMGIGTVTVRFMMDSLRSNNGGFPLADDVAAVAAYIDTVRPVAVKDFFVVSPVPFPVNYSVANLVNNTPSTRAAIIVSLKKMFDERAQPGQTMYFQWADAAIAATVGEEHCTLVGTDTVMPSPGHMPVLGVVSFTS